jgi:hypothetical protein
MVPGSQPWSGTLEGCTTIDELARRLEPLPEVGDVVEVELGMVRFAAEVTRVTDLGDLGIGVVLLHLTSLGDGRTLPSGGPALTG